VNLQPEKVLSGNTPDGSFDTEQDKVDQTEQAGSHPTFPKSVGAKSPFWKFECKHTCLNDYSCGSLGWTMGGSLLAALSLLVVLVATIAFGLVLVIRSTVRKSAWGINANPVNCPRCNRLMPTVRKPRSISQAMWGGWTCEHCGCVMDKWGRETDRS